MRVRSPASVVVANRSHCGGQWSDHRRHNICVGNPDAAQSSEFNSRFLADANRELRRAREQYFDLIDMGL
jgi:hypothetical protein